MNTVKSNYDTSPALGDYYPGLIGRHIQGGFYVIFMENDRWMNLASGESYNKDAPIELPPLGTVVTLTVTA